jgi:putative endopeptidase
MNMGCKPWMLGAFFAASNAWAQNAVPDPPLISGIDLQFIDASIRAQDDFYRHVNGKWLAATQIPADKGRYDLLAQLADVVQLQLKAIVDDLQKTSTAADRDSQKIADLYASFMDEKTLERLGIRALGEEFARIDATANKHQLASLMAHLNRMGVSAPFAPRVHQDAKDARRYVFDLEQSGLGLPDRSYYLENGVELVHARESYARHVKTMLTLAGDQNAETAARSIVALERTLAAAQWTDVENRVPLKNYNKIAFAELDQRAPGFAWKTYLSASGAVDRTTYLIISQPSYVVRFIKIVQRTPLGIWKSYFKWRLLSDFAPYLSAAFADEHFAFYGGVLRGMQMNKPRWQRGIDLLNEEIGEGLAKAYVARYFPPEAKVRMARLVDGLLTAYRDDIGTLDWMGPATKARAVQKLATMTTKIGYPANWRDYSALMISRRDLVGNCLRANVFEYNRNLGKLGRSVDRGEWAMLPQTINAHYDVELNDITFPAAILQPPLFNSLADDAANYGGIGFAIAHEISHGFDDEGSQYDGMGTLLSPPGWFTQADLDAFKAKSRSLVAQYSAYSPLPGYPVNGELTLGENIADVSGLVMAYKAYKLSLAGKPGPMIDGLTGDQRFFMGYARVFRGKTRDGEALMRIKADRHAPEAIRGTVPEMNFTPFYEALGVTAGDGMYLAPDKRVTLW